MFCVLYRSFPFPHLRCVGKGERSKAKQTTPHPCSTPYSSPAASVPHHIRLCAFWARCRYPFPKAVSETHCVGNDFTRSRDTVCSRSLRYATLRAVTGTLQEQRATTFLFGIFSEFFSGAMFRMWRSRGGPEKAHERTRAHPPPFARPRCPDRRTTLALPLEASLDRSAVNDHTSVEEPYSPKSHDNNRPKIISLILGADPPTRPTRRSCSRRRPSLYTRKSARSSQAAGGDRPLPYPMEEGSKSILGPYTKS